MRTAGSMRILHLPHMMALIELAQFLMIDIDLKDFGSKDKLDRALKRILKKIETIMYGHPTVLMTGNGYHIYQPMEGFILEEEDIFAKFIDPKGKDLTTKFMQFAEDFLTNKKRDPQHRPSIHSCLVRIPATINSKCGQEVRSYKDGMVKDLR